MLAIKYREGVVIAGDRRATEGFQIAERRIEKVFKIDDYSAMAIAGAAGPCIEMAKLFQTELEHYEKLEGVQLSCEGKANKLGQMVKANLPMVFQGLGRHAALCRLRSEAEGRPYLQVRYYRRALRRVRLSCDRIGRQRCPQYDAGALSSRTDGGGGAEAGLLALYNAADDDVGTGGPISIRGIYPTAKIVQRGGHYGCVRTNRSARSTTS